MVTKSGSMQDCIMSKATLKKKMCCSPSIKWTLQWGRVAGVLKAQSSRRRTLMKLRISIENNANVSVKFQTSVSIIRVSTWSQFILITAHPIFRRPLNFMRRETRSLTRSLLGFYHSLHCLRIHCSPQLIVPFADFDLAI